MTDMWTSFLKILFYVLLVSDLTIWFLSDWFMRAQLSSAYTSNFSVTTQVRYQLATTDKPRVRCIRKPCSRLVNKLQQPVIKLFNHAAMLQVVLTA